MKKYKLNEMVGNRYCEIDAICAELNDNGIDFYEANCEYITAGYYDNETDEGVQVVIKLSGTQGTVVVESIEEVYRG